METATGKSRLSVYFLQSSCSQTTEITVTYSSKRTMSKEEELLEFKRHSVESLEAVKEMAKIEIASKEFLILQ